MSKLVIIPCGTEATTIIGNIKGLITATSIRYGEVKYELSYFYNADYKQCWLHENELNINKHQKNQIGFK
jgi:hypothetical protein